MLVSVVTPSFNQGEFLEECILSVRDNGYPEVEHIVMDGGSTDGSVEIIRRYENRLAYWTSARDGGQADAINKGWSRCHGDIFAFLNSDDYYFPGAIGRAVELFKQNPDVGVVYGQANVVDDQGRVLSRTNVHVDGQAMLDGFIGLPQPATFIARRVIETVGMLDPSFHFALDGEFFMRALGNFRAIAVDDIFACMRLHPSAKSVATGSGFAPEVLRISEKVLAEPAAYPRYRVDRRKVSAGAQVVSAKFRYMNGEWSKALPLLISAFAGCSYYRRRILLAELPRLAARCLIGRNKYAQVSSRLRMPEVAHAKH